MLNDSMKQHNNNSNNSNNNNNNNNNPSLQGQIVIVNSPSKMPHEMDSSSFSGWGWIEKFPIEKIFDHSCESTVAFPKI